MTIFHGSHLEVHTPKILSVSRVGDFGLGFYTTSHLPQARRWAQIRADQHHQIEGVVSHFAAPDTIFSSPAFNTKQFLKADAEWFDFVISNRNAKSFRHTYDLISGPVADDRVYACFNAYEAGFMDRDTALKQLKTYKLKDQILFHTEKSLLVLNFIKSEVVPCKR